MSVSTVLSPIPNAQFYQCPICTARCSQQRFIRHFRECKIRRKHDLEKFLQCPGLSLHLLRTSVQLVAHQKCCPSYKEALYNFLGPKYAHLGGNLSSPDPFSENPFPEKEQEHWDSDEEYKPPQYEQTNTDRAAEAYERNRIRVILSGECRGVKW